MKRWAALQERKELVLGTKARSKKGGILYYHSGKDTASLEPVWEGKRAAQFSVEQKFRRRKAPLDSLLRRGRVEIKKAGLFSPLRKKKKGALLSKLSTRGGNRNPKKTKKREEKGCWVRNRATTVDLPQGEEGKGTQAGAHLGLFRKDVFCLA